MVERIPLVTGDPAFSPYPCNASGRLAPARLAYPVSAAEVNHGRPLDHSVRPFQAALDGLPITTFKSDKARALLAYLATEAERPHARDMLATLLWPDWPEAYARNSLRSRWPICARPWVMWGQAALPADYPRDDPVHRESDYSLDVHALLEAASLAQSTAAGLQAA